jgi:hypothetical protein
VEEPQVVQEARALLSSIEAQRVQGFAVPSSLNQGLMGKSTQEDNLISVLRNYLEPWSSQLGIGMRSLG